MRKILPVLVLLTAAAAIASAELVRESWGEKGKFTYPGTLKVVAAGKVPRLVFDLSAVPKGATVHHASLSCPAGQPREPIRILAAESLSPGGEAALAGEPLRLEGPWYRSFDATEAVRRWVKDPAANLGFALVSFEGSAVSCHLEILYEGNPRALPPQVEGLEAFHDGGQTFLVWKELPIYRPPAEAILWVERMAGRATQVTSQPAKDAEGFPRAAAITLKTLRDLQGLAVRDKAVGEWAREMAPFKRIKEVPEVRYRVYRHDAKITAENLHQARLIGQVDALSAYQDGFIHIDSHGEYYAPRERGDSIIPTFAVAGGRPVLPGQAYYVHTAASPGKSYYAVTAEQDGTENVAQVSAANSSPAVEETPAQPQPVPQWVTTNRTRYGNADATEYWYAYWLSPPYSNLPDNRPRRLVMAIPEAFKGPGPMVLSTHAGMGPGWKVDNIDKAYLHVEQDVAYGGDLCYNEGRGTLRSFREAKVDYFSDRYVTRMVTWALDKWHVDRSRITSSIGSHYGVRHPELFPILWFGPYEVDYDQKWNPAYGSLSGRLGPAELAMTTDGHRAWDAYNVAWYLRQNVGKDIGFWVHDVNGKESGHAVEYGWQDDAKGLAALRDCRQPHVAHWGGGAISREVVNGLRGMSWTRSVPAFSNCSLDANPGNGDPADGDPWGQINGFLFWQGDTIVDEADRWEMTVYLAGDCFADGCTVDVTPRHCRQFKAKPGESFRWTNTSVKDEKLLGSGTIEADQWGLVTLKALTVTKDRNRITVRGLGASAKVK